MDKAKQIADTLSLLSSMVYGGEKHSHTSEQMRLDALDHVRALESENAALRAELEILTQDRIDYEKLYMDATQKQFAAELAARGPVLSEADELLLELVRALDGAYISSWQSTAEWRKQLDAARDYINKREGNDNAG